jgi:acetyl esterase/lipase
MPNTLYYSSDKDPLRTVDLYTEPKRDLWIIFIHGGAWFISPPCISNGRRDPQQTSHDGDVLMNYLRKTDLMLPLASVNYRLSPAVRHPSHQEDVISVINFLKSTYGMIEFVLVGHSAGGCLAFQCAHLDGCKGVISAEGIYDLEELVKEYPEYQGFVVEAFGENKAIWRKASPTNLAEALPASLSALLVQSTEDELLSGRQTELMYGILQQASVELQKTVWINGGHDEAIRTEEFCSVVYNFVTQILKS